MSLFYIYRDESVIEPRDYSWNFSRLDKFTLAAFLNEKTAIMVSILLMYIYTAVAYFLLYMFSSKMTEFEFYSPNTFLDRFVANHSLIITGVSQQLSTEQVAKKVKKVFDFRFRGEGSKVVSCNAFRKTNDVKNDWRKVKNLKNKVAEYEGESFGSQESKLIWVGSALKCNQRQVDAHKFYSDKLA